MTASASNVHRFGPALRPRGADCRDSGATSPAMSATWPFAEPVQPIPEPVRPSVRWDERAWWTQQLGRPLDAA